MMTMTDSGDLEDKRPSGMRRRSSSSFTSPESISALQTPSASEVPQPHSPEPASEQQAQGKTLTKVRNIFLTGALFTVAAYGGYDYALNKGPAPAAGTSAFDGGNRHGRDTMRQLADSSQTEAAQARLLLRGTYGPTEESLAELMSKTRSEWIKDQAKLPVGAHREFYRHRVNGRIAYHTGSSGGLTPVQPGVLIDKCTKGSRWDRYALDRGDKGEKIEVMEGMIFVGGELRSEIDFENSAADSVDWQHLSDTGYSGYLCEMGDEIVGGSVQMRAEANCRGDAVSMLNPAIFLPTANVGAFPAVFKDVKTGVKVLDTGIDDTTCTSHIFSDGDAHFISIDGSPYRFDARIQLQENTVDNPSGAHPDGECLNVPVTPFNRDGCRLHPTCGRICGSYGEVANDPLKGHHSSFVLYRGRHRRDPFYYYTDWNLEAPFNRAGDYSDMPFYTLAVNGVDQLRQRMAFALQEFIVLGASGVGDGMMTEHWVNAQDIYVRNALGSFRNIMKEMTYNPIMAQYLTFVNSISLERSGGFAPDENYARETMQLFTIGLWELDETEGTHLLASNGERIEAYSNEHVETFARIFTGLRFQAPRNNIEGNEFHNRVDPMFMDPVFRDRYPKINLGRKAGNKWEPGFIGDGYPECSRMPADVSVREGARYRHYVKDTFTGTAVELPTTSKLYEKLCGSTTTSCIFRSQVVLDETLACDFEECKDEIIRYVKVGSGYYEFIRPACVHDFFVNGMMGVRSNTFDTWGQRCMDPRVAAAGPSCCSKECSDRKLHWMSPPRRWATRRGWTDCEGYLTDSRVNITAMCRGWRFNRDRYCAATCDAHNVGYEGDNCEDRGVLSGAFVEARPCNKPHEYVTYATAKKRCEHLGLDICRTMTNRRENQCQMNSNRYMIWYSNQCSFNVEIDTEGKLYLQNDRYTQLSPIRVYWNGGAGNFPKVNSTGHCPEKCEAPEGKDTCICPVTVKESPIFGLPPANADDIKSKAFFGALKPKDMVSETGPDGSYTVYLRGAAYDESTVFEIAGKFYSNRQSKVYVGDDVSADFSFRNPPSFMNFNAPKVYEAWDEIDAWLDMLVYHPNTPFYVSSRLIQRLVTSNPSKEYVKAVAEAFRTGKYDGVVYGGFWGDLQATAAAILLHPEADGEGSSTIEKSMRGHLREPLLRLLQLLRSLKFKEEVAIGSNRPLTLAGLDFGQSPFAAPSVFNFFHFEYTPHFLDDGFFAPEFELMTVPSHINFMNGLVSLVEEGGLSHQGAGFGQIVVGGENGYNFTLPVSDGAEATVAKLDLYLTGGRMTKHSKDYAIECFNAAQTASDKVKAVERVIVLSAEFNVDAPTGTGAVRPPIDEPQLPDPADYKALVYIYLSGGADTYNLLVPGSYCSLWTAYEEIRGIAKLPWSDFTKIDADPDKQPCGSFGVHNSLDFLAELYKNSELIFLPDMGNLAAPITKEQWAWKGSSVKKCAPVFSHPDGTRGAQSMTCQDHRASQRGFGGRIADVLNGLSKKSTSFSMGSTAIFSEGKATEQMIIHHRHGAIKYVHHASTDTAINKMTGVIYNNTLSDGYASQTRKILHESDQLSTIFGEASDASSEWYVSPAGWPTSRVGYELKKVTELIKMRGGRGTERDVFYVTQRGYDTHSKMHGKTNQLFSALNVALRSYVEELRAQGVFDKVVTMVASDFGRTLTPNAGGGTDHAWSGNYFVFGGDVAGGKLLGSYLESLEKNSPQEVGRGRILPTHSYEAILHPIARWMGVPELQEKYVFPNIDNFDKSKHIFSQSEVFKNPAA